MLAEGEKVVLNLTDLLEWIVEDVVTWDYGSEAFADTQVLISIIYVNDTHLFCIFNYSANSIIIIR